MLFSNADQRRQWMLYWILEYSVTLDAVEKIKKWQKFNLVYLKQIKIDISIFTTQ